MTLANLTQLIFWKILCLMIVGIYKIHSKEINIKNRVYNYYFVYSINQSKKNVLIDEKNDKDLIIYFIRYGCEKSINWFSQVVSSLGSMWKKDFGTVWQLKLFIKSWYDSKNLSEYC